MKGKRVLIITDTLYDANGVSRFIQDLAFYAKKEKKPLMVVTSTKKKHCKSSSNIFVLECLFTIPIPFYPELDLVFINPFKLYYFIKKYKPDVIHISTPGPIAFFGRFIAKWFHIPLYGTYHTDFPFQIYANIKSKLVINITTYLLRQFYRRFKVLFVRSREYFGIVKSQLGFREDKIYSIPAGIDLKKFNPNFKDRELWHEKYGLPKDAILALYVGRLTIEKNVPFLLELWKEIANEHPKAWLVLIGSGKYYEKIDEYKEHNILLLGHKEGKELSTLYASADFFVFPSTTDTLGQVVMEALASGLPVIVSNKGGPKTLVNKEYENGYIVEVDKQQFKEAIVEFVLDEKKRKKLSAGATNSAKNFSFAKSFEFYWQVHQI